MRKDSIFFKINTLFIIALITTIFAFGFAMTYSQKKVRADEFFKMRVVLGDLRRNNNLQKESLELLGAQIIKGKNKERIIKNAKIFQPPNLLHRHRFSHIVLLKYRHKRFYLIKYGFNDYLLFFPTHQKGLELIVVILFLSIIIFLIINYWLIRKSLQPLALLERDINNYSNGFDLTPKYIKSNNEVARINNAFYDYATKAKALSRSRELFIRNIFHELNTPVTKGKLLAEVSQDPKTKQMLSSIFNRLDTLLKELAQMEKITSKSYILESRKVPIIELIDSAKELLYLKEIRHNLKGETLNCDFQAMQIVFKNLIDNANRYGNELYIEYKERQICFINRGSKLKKPLEYYTQPFTTSSGSFGLGLYIVKEILDMHTMRLHYSYKNGFNHFCIEWDK